MPSPCPQNCGSRCFVVYSHISPCINGRPWNQGLSDKRQWFQRFGLCMVRKLLISGSKVRALVRPPNNPIKSGRRRSRARRAQIHALTVPLTGARPDRGGGGVRRGVPGWRPARRWCQSTTTARSSATARSPFLAPGAEHLFAKGWERALPPAYGQGARSRSGHPVLPGSYPEASRNRRKRWGRILALGVRSSRIVPFRTSGRPGFRSRRRPETEEK